jgi:hypothetical protein
VKPVLRPSGRKGGFSPDALAQLARAVRDASTGQERATARGVRRALGWGRTTTYAALSEAVARGLVERVGATKGTWYRAAGDA